MFTFFVLLNATAISWLKQRSPSKAPTIISLSFSTKRRYSIFFKVCPKMPRMRLPIFQKVSSNLLKVSIIIGKMRKPIIPKLILFKKSRKLKKFKLMRHYNYGFLTEYQFSPSNSPLIQYRRKPVLRYKGLQQVYSMLFLCRCLGGLRDGGGRGDVGDYSLQALPAMEDDRRKQGALLEPMDWKDEDDSIDLKAERFIERFYEEMRMQRLISL